MTIEYASAGFFNDGEIIKNILDIHSLPNPRILDVTYNSGRIWKGLAKLPVKCDINPKYSVDVVSDFRFIPFRDKSFDVVVFDPPHLSIHGAAGNNEVYGDFYGINTFYTSGRDGLNVIPMFLPLLLEVKRILVTDGILISKISDTINANRYHWQHVAFINLALQLEMTPCDMLVKIRNTKRISSNWKKVRHFRKNHCYWMVVRNSNKCERP